MQSGDYIPLPDSCPQPDPCPFCGHTIDRETAELWYNGPGPPPSYSMTCGDCGAQGSSGYGRERDDHFNARVDAVKKWNDRVSIPPQPKKMVEG